MGIPGFKLLYKHRHNIIYIYIHLQTQYELRLIPLISGFLDLAVFRMPKALLQRLPSGVASWQAKFSTISQAILDKSSWGWFGGSNLNCLVVTGTFFYHFLFFFSISHMVCHPNPIDELIFFKMVETTNQWSFGNDSDGLIACFRLIFQSCARLGRGLSDVAGELFASAQLTSRGLPNLWSFGDNMITLWLFNIAIWKITFFL